MKRLVLLAVLGLLLGLGPAHANYWEGHEAFRRGDYYTAHAEFLRLAKLGHAASQFNLGYLYHHGLAVRRDPAEAAHWYREAAAQGRVEAQFSLGTLYETGSGVPRDPVEAYRWYNLAVSNVPPGASRDRLIRHRERIAGTLTAGELSAVEAAPAPAGFTLGADLQRADSARIPAPSVADLQRELAARSFNPGAIDGQMGRSTLGALSAFQASVGLAVTGELDPPTLAKLFGPEEVAPRLEPFPREQRVRSDPAPPAVPVPPVEAIDLEPYPAPSDLAEAPTEEPAATAANELAVPRPPAETAPAETARKSAAQDAGVGTVVATAGDGDGLAASELDGLRRRAEQGDANAQIDLATMYHYGQGVKQDYEAAVTWYARAARQGRIEALYPLGSLSEALAEGPEDLIAAYRWYSLAADLVPAGKAHDIIVERRDRVAKQLPGGLLAAGGNEAASGGAEGVSLRNRPIESAPSNRPPTGLVFTGPDGAPPAATSAAAVTVAENAPGGTALGTVSALDPDGEEGLAYRLSDDAGGRFAIDRVSGTLTVAEGAQLDFEAAARHEIVVRVSDLGGLTLERTLSVALQDINEAPRAEAVTLRVAEGAAGGTLVGRVRAVDPDGGSNGALRYDLAEGPFAIDPATGDLTVAEGAQLDFETAPRFELAVAATDGGGLSVRLPVTVDLEDVNEAPDGIAVTVGGRVPENAPPETVAARVSAADPDAGDRLTYSLIEDADGRFAIDPDSGTIWVTGGKAGGAGLDFEDAADRFTVDPDTGLIVSSQARPLASRGASGHRLVVRVTDAGGLSREFAIAIEVVDVNELPALAAAAFTLDENAPGGTPVGQIRASDPDGGTNGELRYSITDGDGRFRIDAASGRIAVADGAALDFETEPEFELTVTATDGGGLGDDALVTVALVDRNEPPAALGMTGGTVKEQAAPGTLVAQLLASDPDAGDRLAFSLTDDAGGRFTIDAKTGTVTVAEGAALDFDLAASHEIGVRVTDSSGLSAEERVTLNVTNENFAPTALALSNESVAENAAAGTLVAEISASDPDAGERLAFSLADDAGGRFAIDAETGRITVSDGARLDYEREARHQLRVRAVDSGGLATEEALAIAVLDVNEPPSLEAASFRLDENAAPGTTVGRLRASDPDRGDNGRLRYAITQDDSDGRFAVDPATGVVTLADGADLDFESRRAYALEVTATDGAGLSAGAAVTIALADRNEPPNGMRLIGGRVPETAARGRPAGQVTAFDPDAGDSLTYSLNEDADGRFAIDTRTGMLTVADGTRLDFETAARHRIVVRATDAGGLTYDGVLSIALIDANEAPAAKSAPLLVLENAAPGTAVGRVEAADPDRGDRLAFVLSDDADGRFAIDWQSGEITVADGAALDFEADPGFELIAKVTDSGGLSDTVVVPVALADRNEAPSGGVAIDGMVAENAAPGTLAAAVAAHDPDVGERLTYRLIDDAGGRFVIDGRTGVILVADGARFDYERAPEHRVRVRVEDTGGLSFEDQITIALLDVDETPAAATPSKADLLAQANGGPDGALAEGRDVAGFANGHADTDGASLGRDLDGAPSVPHNGAGAADGEFLGVHGTARMVNWVETLQAQLTEAGFDPGPVDGKMGPRTRAALDRYQDAFRLADLPDEDLLNHMLVRAHFRRGYKLQVQGDFEKSLGEYGEVVRIDPGHFSAYFNRGLVYYAERRYDLAVEDFDTVIGLRPDYAGAYVNRGNAYYRQGRYVSAAEDYVKAIGLWVVPW